MVREEEILVMVIWGLWYGGRGRRVGRVELLTVYVNSLFYKTK